MGEQMLKQMGVSMSRQDQKEMTAMQKQMFDGMREQSKKEAEQKWKSYINNAEEKNAAAFAVIDKDKSGALEKNEVINALMPDTEVNKKFMQALGLLTSEEAEMAQMAQDCKQQ